MRTSQSAVLAASSTASPEVDMAKVTKITRAPCTDNTESITLERTGDADLQFIGRPLFTVETQRTEAIGGERWHVYQVYQTVGNAHFYVRPARLVISKEGHSTIEGET